MIYGQFSVAGRRFNMNNLWDDPRGLTGSEVSFFSLSRELAKTHNISIFTIHSTKEPTVWEGCKVFDIDELPHRRHAHRTQAEAACSNFGAFCSPIFCLFITCWSNFCLSGLNIS